MDSYVHLIALSNKGASVYLIEMPYKSWQWLAEGLTQLGGMGFEELGKKNSIWTPREVPTPWAMRAPPIDSLLGRELKRYLSELWTEGWYGRYRQKGIILPRFEGVSAKLLYHYPSGIYVNYDIEKVYYSRQFAMGKVPFQPPM